ncbi:MAG: hypothetical protein J6U64_03725, partial [Alphaproteobacteria bacterium]|nr:hypothetical protein [Alphaproteobacteria bacterium]
DDDECVCVEIPLYSCATGDYTRMISCDPTKYNCENLKGCADWGELIGGCACDGAEGGIGISDTWTPSDNFNNQGNNQVAEAEG